MTRDMDLVRSLLLGIEAVPAGANGAYIFEAEPSDEVYYHLKIMRQHGLLDVQLGPESDDEGVWYIIADLTWEGCDFLNNVRDDEIWRKTKDGLGATGKVFGGASLDLMKALAKGFMKTQIETRTGVKLDI